MTDRKCDSKHENAGRPKQTNIFNTVNDIITQMRGKLILFICLFAFCGFVFADTLQGNITYTEETARQEAFKGVSLKDENFKIKPKRYFLDIKNIDNNQDILTVSRGKAKIGIIPIFTAYMVIYKDDPKRVYFYEKSHIKDKYIVYATQTEIGNKTYPRKFVKYDDNGNLMSISLIIGLEVFVFDKDKKRLGYWLGTEGKLIEYPFIKGNEQLIYSAQ